MKTIFKTPKKTGRNKISKQYYNLNKNFIIQPLWRYLSILILALVILLINFKLFAQPAIISNKAIFSPVNAQSAMVVTSDSTASRIGINVLKKGGNAVDAAVTIGFVMAVTFPRAGNIGGGGFMLIHSAKSGNIVSIDYREKAPAAAHRDMFLDKAGKIDSGLSRHSHLSAGVPGTVAGLASALEKYGTISLKEALAPAIDLAKNGLTVTTEFSDAIKKGHKRLKKWNSSQKIFLKPNGNFYEPGDKFVQKDLAETLTKIADNGAKAFYEGEIATLIVKEMKKNNGLITKADLTDYRPVIRKPVKGSYRGYEIYSMSPPSSGGIHIIQILNILEGYDILSMGHNSAATIHLMSESMKMAYADRSKYLGDPDFTNVPAEGLTSKKYAGEIRKKIDISKTLPSKDIRPGMVNFSESNETTHFSVVDKYGNAVSNTYTLNFSFGSGIVVDGAGFLLNNEMDDFSAKPGEPNAYGLIGGVANAIEPNKRMLSSMAPTIVLKDTKPFLITGSPGGSRIITTVVQIIMNIIDHGMNIQEAVNAPRIHHQWLPDEIRVEKGISPDTINILKSKGHKISLKRTMGAASTILIDYSNKTVFGASDPRRKGLAIGN